MFNRVFRKPVVTAFSDDQRILADHSLIEFNLGEGRDTLKLKSGNMSSIDDPKTTLNLDENNSYMSYLKEKLEDSHVLLLCESVKSENVKFEEKNMNLKNGKERRRLARVRRRIKQEEEEGYFNIYNNHLILKLHPELIPKLRHFTNRDSDYYDFKKQGEYSVFFKKKKINDILFGDKIELKDKQVGIKVTIHQNTRMRGKAKSLLSNNIYQMCSK